MYVYTVTTQIVTMWSGWGDPQVLKLGWTALFVTVGQALPLANQLAFVLTVYNVRMLTDTFVVLK